uniref:Uncharacterized protein n=1 Tax=Cucumis melo TaxID=3656 RepID=A0A9I9EJK0_CUCME
LIETLVNPSISSPSFFFFRPPPPLFSSSLFNSDNLIHSASPKHVSFVEFWSASFTVAPSPILIREVSSARGFPPFVRCASASLKPSRSLSLLLRPSSVSSA